MLPYELWRKHFCSVAVFVFVFTVKTCAIFKNKFLKFYYIFCNVNCVLLCPHMGWTVFYYLNSGDSCYHYVNNNHMFKI